MHLLYLNVVYYVHIPDISVCTCYLQQQKINTNLQKMLSSISNINDIARYFNHIQPLHQYHPCLVHQNYQNPHSYSPDASFLGTADPENPVPGFH